MDGFPKLLKALRSGEYLQGTGQLRSGGYLCVLGVAADLYIKEFPDKARWEKDKLVHEVPDSEHGPFISNTDLFWEIAEWCGLGRRNVTTNSNYPEYLRYVINYGEIPLSLMCMNDRSRMNYAEIANFLEANITLGRYYEDIAPVEAYDTSGD